ncbi:MAG: hypothetical protein ACRD20_15015 [Terriglobales bacterium]
MLIRRVQSQIEILLLPGLGNISNGIPATRTNPNICGILFTMGSFVPLLSFEVNQ